MTEAKSRQIHPQDLNAKWDACIDLTVHRLVSSSLAGAFAGLLLFRSPTTRWASVAFGAGIGFGSAYIESSYIFSGPPKSPHLDVSVVSTTHGCPLSPLLFSIAMEGLSEMLNPNSIYGFSGYTHGNTSISHLLFADDLLVFGEATQSNLAKMSSILEDFGNLSGLTINNVKSSICFSKTVTNQQVLSTQFGISVSDLPWRYLGLPITNSRLKIAAYHPLISTLARKFSCWKATNLSMAGSFSSLLILVALCSGCFCWLRFGPIYDALAMDYLAMFLVLGASFFCTDLDNDEPLSLGYSGRQLQLVGWATLLHRSRLKMIMNLILIEQMLRL